MSKLNRSRGASAAGALQEMPSLVGHNMVRWQEKRRPPGERPLWLPHQTWSQISRSGGGQIFLNRPGSQPQGQGGGPRCTPHLPCCRPSPQPGPSQGPGRILASVQAAPGQPKSSQDGPKKTARPNAPKTIGRSLAADVVELLLDIMEWLSTTPPWT